MKEKIVNCKEIADKIIHKTSLEIESIYKKYNTKPKFSIFLVGQNPSSLIYVSRKIKIATLLNIDVKLHQFPENITQDELLLEINKINSSDANGIIVQLPLPIHIDALKIGNAVNPNKDIDGLCVENIGKLHLGLDYSTFFQPCTALGCIEVLKHLNIALEGKKCVIVNRSNIVGKPLIAMLLHKNATVTILHSKSINTNNELTQADIIFTAVGKRNFITKDKIQENAIIIDIGINKDANEIFGDCNLQDCISKAKYITPVPNGIGQLTIAFLMQNILKAFKLSNNFTI